MPDQTNSPTRIELTDEQRKMLRVGDVVVVRLDDGSEVTTTVRMEPWQLGHGTWAIGLKGISGGYSLARVVAILSTAHSAGPVARCERCWWPLKETTAEGCIEGNCSERGR